MSVTVLQVRSPSVYETENAAYNLGTIVRVKNGNSVYGGLEPSERLVLGEIPQRLALYGDLAGHYPWCSIVQWSPGSTSGRVFSVIGLQGEQLGVIRLPARGDRRQWRPRYELELPDGSIFAGRRGSVTAWTRHILLSPLLVVWNVLGFLGGHGFLWDTPKRVAWRKKGGSWLGRVPLKYYGISGKYKVRGEQLDIRVSYAQAVLHTWSG